MSNPVPPQASRNPFVDVAKGILSLVGRTWMALRKCPVPRSCRVFGVPALWGMYGTLTLGERVTLHCVRTGYLPGSPFPTCSFSAKPGASIAIGDDSFVALSVFHAAKGITLGERVLVGSGCRIMDHDGHTVDRVPRKEASIEGAEPIVLEDDVWLGCDVTVCKGVTIGKGSVIGTKSVVTHDIPPGVLAAGAPATVIRPLRPGKGE